MSSRARSSRMADRSCTRRRRRPCSPRRREPDERPAARGIHLRARDLRRERGHLEGAHDAAHAAHVRRECDPRHHHRRRDARGDRRARPGRHGARLPRRRARHDQRGRWIRGDGPHAPDVSRASATRQAPTRTGGEVVEQLRELVPWVYFIAAITFVLGLKGLSGPTTAQLGNRIAATGMLLAVIATFLETQVAAAWLLVVPAIAIGTAVGFVGARRVPMTAMPQMVAIFNGAGGGAAALVSMLEYLRATSAGGASVGEVIAILLGLMIGSVSFSGSIIAFGKLQGLIDAKAFKYAGQQLVTGGLFAGMLLLALVLVADAAGILAAPKELALGLVGLLALAFGVALVMPI